MGLVFCPWGLGEYCIPVPCMSRQYRHLQAVTQACNQAGGMHGICQLQYCTAWFYKIQRALRPLLMKQAALGAVRVHWWVQDRDITQQPHLLLLLLLHPPEAAALALTVVRATPPAPSTEAS